MPTAVAVTRTIGAPPEAVYAFLERLENHWQLTSGFASVETLVDPPGGDEGARIVVHGPLGIRRRARTRLLRCEPPAGGRPGVVAGTASDAAGSTAEVEWRVSGKGTGSRVELVTAIREAHGLDRLLLALGGGWWLRRGLERSLGQLEQALAQRR
jgi:carbon monoxide dehydrogenase subunit G